jgi:methionine sulfoxide reductase heme-binding subunit
LEAPGRSQLTSPNTPVEVGTSSQTLQRKRFNRRLALHHLPLFALSTVAVVLFYIIRPIKDVWTKLSFSTAYPALFLLLITLLIGPFNVLTRRRNPISSDLRRDVGIWAGILTLIHSVVGQNVHLRGHPWLYYVYAAREHHSFPIRHNVFGVGNYTGLVATLIVIALLATSNDYFLRRLGTPKWKRLQRWNYAVYALTAVHAWAYLTIEHQKRHFVLTIAVALAITLLTQTIAYYKRHTTATP